MQHTRAADLRTIMPRHANPKELTINLTAVDDRHAPRDRPISSPIALEGIDLSSIDGGIGQSSLPALPASPPASSPSSRKTSASKSEHLQQEPTQGKLQRAARGNSAAGAAGVEEPGASYARAGRPCAGDRQHVESIPPSQGAWEHAGTQLGEQRRERC